MPLIIKSYSDVIDEMDSALELDLLNINYEWARLDKIHPHAITQYSI